MSLPQRNLLLAVAGALALGFAGGAWLLVQAPPASSSAGTVPAPIAPPLEKSPPASPDRQVELVKAEAEPIAATTVVFPLKVELELLASEVRPNADGVGALGSEATARLAGSVHGASGEGLQAEINAGLLTSEG